jgi:hypothetical protein
MSSYDPHEEESTGSSRDPGVKEKEITDEREFSDTFAKLDGTDYIVFGTLLGLPAGALTIFLVLHFVPGFPDTAESLLRWLWDLFPPV